MGKLAERIDRWPNLVTMFFDRVEERGDAGFLHVKRDGAWTPLSWNDAARTVASLAAGLRGIGVKPGDRVVLVSENRPEWCLADLAIMAAGGVTVPAYTTNTEEDHLHILENSGASAVFVSTPKLAASLLPAVYRAAACRAVIGIDPLKIGQASGAATLHQWSALIAGQRPDITATRAAAVARREDLACLIYTSGTSGSPRGVRQHHGALLSNVAGAAALVEEDFAYEDGNERFLSFLPLSHAYEHTGGQYLPIAMGSAIYYAEGLEKLAANMAEVGPTIMFVVPRLFEVLRGRIVKAIEKQGGISVVMFNRALKLGRKRCEGRLSLLERPLDAVLDLTVRKKVAGRFGGRLKALVSGGAPLNPEVGMFFAALGMTLLQGYGQTESGPLISCNRPKARIKMHTVGPPLRNVEVRIAPDGEICVRGELVMDGYWVNDAESHRVLKDGWLLTGDIGHIDKDGHIVITDRKKDIIVNDKGDNVAPQRVEGMLTLQDEISQAMVAGDKRPYLVGLVVPDPEWALAWAAEKGMPHDLAKLADEPEFKRALMVAVDRVNARLSVVERVRRVVVAPAPFTVENGQMTPSLKIKRHVLKGVYGERLDKLYGG